MMDHQSVTVQLAVDGGISHGRTMKKLSFIAGEYRHPLKSTYIKMLASWYMLVPSSITC